MTSRQYRFWNIYGKVVVYFFFLMFALNFPGYIALSMESSWAMIYLYVVGILDVVAILMILVASIFAKNRKILAAISGKPYCENDSFWTSFSGKKGGSEC